ncbi:MAG: 2,3-bisphosphoglycerate-independent phosphoglycerate mutase [Desulfovibrionales bacterium]|nr:2,3-bisphosphoglycerate-independent phosphoglycerate mutase [Desulfovibrionales bacterium]
MRPRPVLLIILDGWGYSPHTEGNAIYLARTPNMDDWSRRHPLTFLKASGEAVGLPEGQMGNSEVGHLNIGAGRIVYQDLTRINRAITSNDFFKVEPFITLMDKVGKNAGALHLLGLVSDGGVHSDLPHLFALIEMAKRHGVKDVYLHAFMDGRDTPPQSGKDYIVRVTGFLSRTGVGKIATICGRYYAMDRDNRWERVETAYRALVRGEGAIAHDPVQAVSEAYERGETDEFIRPIVIADGGKPLPRISEGDGVIFFNFRADRAREITRAFTQKAFSAFDVQARPKLAGYVTMTEYDAHFQLPVAFPPQHLFHILGEEISRHGLKQLRIAETEKYAHVTYFFNGGEETPFKNEDRCLVPSPKDVPTYDFKPEMSAHQVTEEVIRRIKTGDYDLIVLNYANPDMVGHTGILKAAIRACEAVDLCLGKVVNTFLEESGGAVIITADHGNAEEMIDPGDGSPHTAHTANLVPFILIDGQKTGQPLRRGILADIAPTILSIQGLPVPEEMTGTPLFVE